MSFFTHELIDLQTNGFTHNGIIWNVEFFFSGDWKYMATISGKNAANSNYFCIFCECNKTHRYNMDLIWLNGENKKGKNIYFIFIIIILFDYLIIFKILLL
jgi:hypothetical protein